MLFQYKTLRKVYNQYFLLMQSQIQAKKNDETFKIVKINENEFKNPYLHPYKPGREHLWNESSDYNFLTYEQTCESTLAAHFSNGFFSAFFYAYNSHGDVKITPDDVWLTIMLYFSNYVNDHAEQLRKAFVSHQGKKELIVITENELLQTQWDQFFDLMIQAIKKNTSNEVTDKFQSNFTTTGRIQKILSTAAVMNIFKHYFQYTRYIVECGIHQVHFGGTLQDWQKIRQKTKDLQDFDVDGKLKTYIAKLIPILDLFVETYKGNPNVQHWNQILDEKRGFQGSGSTSQFTGWLTHFFGIYEPTEQVNIGTIGVDFKIDNKITNVIKNVKLVGGFRAVNLSGESKRVFRPHLSLAILHKKHH